MLDKVVVVTRKTRLQQLVERFNTVGQARFYIGRAGGDFAQYQEEDDAYRRSLDVVRKAVDVGLKTQFMDRSLTPTTLFSASDMVVTVGQDGLVANTAKYVGTQPIVAVNPDPARVDGVLLPFAPEGVHTALQRVLEEKARMRPVTLAQVELSDGQTMLAFNDLFIGAKSHSSALYRIEMGGKEERHSSSGVLVTTGAGSTGWFSSMFNMVAGVASAFGGKGAVAPSLPWEDPRLAFVVREPFRSRHSQASLVAGMLEKGHTLVLESQMPSGGVIFSDGMEQDFLAFNAGVTARIHAAPVQARLVVP